MPSGFKINWSKHDGLIRAELPYMTVEMFGKKFLPDISPKAIGARARKLNIRPARYQHSDVSKQKIANAINKNHFTIEQDKFLLNNANTISIKQLAKQLGFDKTAIWRRLLELGYNHKPEFSRNKKLIANQLAGQKPEVIKKLSKASKKVWQSKKFREAASLAAIKRYQDGFTPHGFIAGYYESSKAGKIYYQSSYELAYFKQLDVDPAIIEYKVHPFVIPYIFEKCQHNYIPDILINNRILVEIKPEDLVNKPKNLAKRQAAEAYCTSNNLVYQLITEKDLGI